MGLLVRAHFFILKGKKRRSYGRINRPFPMLEDLKQTLKRLTNDKLCHNQTQAHFQKGKKNCWPRPELCLRCHGRQLWGHGYVASYFDGFDQPLYLKRYRCPACGCVIKMKPAGYLKRFQAPTDTIRSSIGCRPAKRLLVDRSFPQPQESLV